MLKSVPLQILALGLVIGEGTGISASQVKPRVVATSSVICDLVKTIAKSGATPDGFPVLKNAHQEKTIDLKCLIKAGTDPHVYQPTPEDRKAIEEAQLILYSGYDFEKTLIKLIHASTKGGQKVAVAEIAVPKPQTFEEDGQAVTDPHVWHNAKNGIAMVKIIEEKLSQLEPNRKVAYQQTANKLNQRIDKIDSWIKTSIATIPVRQKRLVTTHDALGYYSKAYNIPIIGALQGVSTEEKPTPKRIRELVDIIRAAKVPTIFVEVSNNRVIMQTVAKEAKVKISPNEIYADGLGERGSSGDTYPKMLIANTKNIVQGLGGKLTSPPN